MSEKENKNIEFKEKEIMNDMILTEKYMSSSYNAAALKSSNTPIKNTFISINEDEQLIENELLAEMMKRKFLNFKDASSDEINSVKSEFKD